jgi:hypothetical protein
LGFKFRIKFGCAFGDEKYYHQFVRVSAVKMNAFDPHAMPGTAAARATSAAFIRLIHDNNNQLEIDDDDDDDFMVLGDWFGLAPSPAAAAITNMNHVAPAVPSFTRSKFPRMKQYESTWWTRYLVPEARANLIDHPNGRRHGQFRKLFHIWFSVVLGLLDILKRGWYPNWRAYATCAAGKPVLHIEFEAAGLHLLPHS